MSLATTPPSPSPSPFPSASPPTTLSDWLDDLSVRFLLNLPDSELREMPRIAFQVEEAQWFYEDFIRPASLALGHPLPQLRLEEFFMALMHHCPILTSLGAEAHKFAFDEFLRYKQRVPVRGAILLDDRMEKVVLVKGWKSGSSWSFPRGKINKDERDIDCAVREVFEETGFDVRGAGLMPQDEEGVKRIDVTMREQHISMFVFRGVDLETAFEPQTRKEISKVEFWNLQDLPGYKKVKGKAQHQQVAGGKFYMVASFMGQLKKWIAEERNRDVQKAARASVPGTAGVPVEEEAQEDTEVAEENAVDAEAQRKEQEKSEMLRRLMGVGGPAPQPEAIPAMSGGEQKPDLLSLLRGTAPKPASITPHTPLEQIDAFPPQPESPHPRHARHPLQGYQHQPVPQFPFSPERLQAQQRNASMPLSGTLGSGSQGFAPPQHQHSMGPPRMPQQQPFQQHRQAMPTAPQYPLMLQNDAPFAPIRQPMQPPPQPQQPMPHLASPALDLQGPQGALGAGPPVPKAENLPMPRLNAHSLSLLNAFRSPTNKYETPHQNFDQAKSKQPSQHQKALLDLFRKPSDVQVEEAGSASPAPIDTTVRPAVGRKAEDVEKERDRERKKSATLNEITRTLPPKLKAKKPQQPPPPPPPAPAAAPVLAQQTQRNDSLATPQVVDRSRSRSRQGQPFDPSNPRPTTPRTQQNASIPQRPLSAAHSPKPRHSPKVKPSPARRGAENVSTVAPPPPASAAPAFTILTRPGSGQQQQQRQQHKTSDVTVGMQVLRRPESVDPATVQKVAEVVEKESSNSPDGVPAEDKRERLLELLGKSSGAVSPVASTPAAKAAKTSTEQPGPAEQRSTLLHLFTASGNGVASPVQPPPRPDLKPESKRPSQQGQGIQILSRQPQQTQQNMLLDLFNKPSAAKGSVGDSPGTPISPFLLGTPATRLAPAGLQGPSSLASSVSAGEKTRQDASTPTPVTAGEVGEGKEWMGSLASNGDGDVGESRKGSGAGTPVDGSKGFLLDYLNGVVRNEGGRKR